MTRANWSKFNGFFSSAIWRLDGDDLPKSRAIWLKPARILLLTIHGFIKDRCTLRASALTFYSLLSVVPVVAMAFGISKGFGLEQRLEKQLYLRFAGQEEIISRIIDFARSLLENTKGGLIAGIGVALLFWSAIKVLGHIEGALNAIWKVRARTFIRKFSDYLAIMIISPLLIIVSSSVNVFITTQVKAISGKLALLQAASPVIVLLLKLLPFGLIWLLFILIYMVMPNTQVRFSSALTSGIIAGTVYQIFQGIYISAQVLVSQYNAIYGSFAALPLFLVWLQVSWMIVLLGAEIAYNHQHVSRHTMVADHRKATPDFRKRYALHILRLIVLRFRAGDPPLTAPAIAALLRGPLLLVEELIGQMLQSNLLVAVESGKTNGPKAYHPAKDISTITVASALEALDKCGQTDPPVVADEAFQTVSSVMDELHKTMAASSANRFDSRPVTPLRFLCHHWRVV
jgi:membrane protein